MKRLLGAILCLLLLAGAGYAAHRLGLLERFAGTAPSGESPSTVTSAGAPPPGGVVGGGPPSAPAGQPAAASPGTAPAPPSEPAVPFATAGAAEPSAGRGVEPPTTAAGVSAPVTVANAVPQSAGAPIPPGLVAVALPGQPIANKAFELRVTDVRTAPAIGNRAARQGREFVVVGTAWKSLIPPQKVNRKKVQDRTAGMGGLGFGGGATAKDKADDEANTTIEEVPFAIGPIPLHVWLIVDGRDAEPIAVDATRGVDGPLPTGTLTIPGFEKVVSGGLAFEATAGARSLSLMVLDSKNGHVLIPITGATPMLSSGLGGASRSNDLVDLALAETSWAEAAPSMPGTKTLYVGLRGISRQPAIAQIPFGSFAFLQTDQGCVAQPEARAPQVRRPLAPMGVFLPFVPSEGQLAFNVPAETKGATLLVRLRQGGSIDLPVLGDGSVTKPTAVVATHEDGSVLRVRIVGTSAGPAGLARPRPGFEAIVVDYLVENLKAGSGLELQPGQQFALADAQAAKYLPDRASQQLPCRLTGANVVPAGGWRRFSLLYLVPEGQPVTLQYRGFETPGSLTIR